MHYFSPLFW